MSELGPIDPTAIPGVEKTNDADSSWITRKIAATTTAQIFKTSYDALKAAGNQVFCLSPWGGHASPLLLPSLHFQHMATKAAKAATGGLAAIAAPVLSAEPESLNPMFEDTVSVALGIDTGFELIEKIASNFVSGRTIEMLLSSTDIRLTTTSIKSMTITHKHKEIKSDAALGFFRSSIHEDPSLVSGVKDYLSIEKGWFNPYLFASGRRPLIPRTMKPDVIFCHGPQFPGDYKICRLLLRESATVIQLCEVSSPEDSLITSPVPSRQQSIDITKDLDDSQKETNSKYKPLAKFPKYRSLSKYITKKDSVLPDRRLLITVVGIKPPNKSTNWITSYKPDKSNIHYSMLNGIPSIVIPAKTGCPLIAWDTLTLGSIYRAKEKKESNIQGIVEVLLEYLSFCVDWGRMTVPSFSPTTSVTSESSIDIEEGKKSLKDAIAALVVGVVKSKENKAVGEEIDLERTGIVMFRIP